ncbi:hypothetical protein LOTGIDRAFT_222728 [Lottia gigantea]|uniref:GA-binding protein alpha chain n=1 Tax=Lottia gigantea TaxID=225164 RepID=V3ZR45_LOTGI|nr:hypothetical protein LOTGIDRAFT_222728 [Lottia gigantea]ESO83336.1 hypothetical protein LOTGIDRAFT_222728 [Lottia gigantea]
MKRALSPTVPDEDSTDHVEAIGQLEIVQNVPEEKRQRTEEVCLEEGVVYAEEVIHQQPAPSYQNLIIQHMDIAEPLMTLKRLLEIRLQCSLSDHEFYLQDSVPLDQDRSLVDQCVQGEGMVQINLEVKSQPGVNPKINIVDILKTADEVDEAIEEVPPVPSTPTLSHIPALPSSTPGTPNNTKVVIPLPEENENVTRWIVDQNFRKEQERLKIPFDPMQWNEVHVKHWIQWAVKEFDLQGVNTADFRMTGKQLAAMTHAEFVKYVPSDPNDVFWTHLELLRKCKFVGRLKTVAKHPRSRSPRITGDERLSPGNRTGNNGQIQLWQFLLEQLTDKDSRNIISWVGDEGEFKLIHPEMVAQLWGRRKNKPTMNYEKLSRALRYYYDGDMIAKVHGKRFVYKFVCDLKMLLGYSAEELHNLVNECASKKYIEVPVAELQNMQNIKYKTLCIKRGIDQKTQTS